MDTNMIPSQSFTHQAWRDSRVPLTVGGHLTTEFNAVSLDSSVNYDQPFVKPSIEKTGRNLRSCVVCGTNTYWSFYGALVCDPCRTFFRRQVLSNRMLVCEKFKDCEINQRTRKNCGWCRFEKCLKVGMKPAMVEMHESSKSGKTSSAVRGSNLVPSNKVVPTATITSSINPRTASETKSSIVYPTSQQHHSVANNQEPKSSNDHINNDTRCRSNMTSLMVSKCEDSDTGFLKNQNFPSWCTTSHEVLSSNTISFENSQVSFPSNHLPSSLPILPLRKKARISEEEQEEEERTFPLLGDFPLLKDVNGPSYPHKYDSVLSNSSGEDINNDLFFSCESEDVSSLLSKTLSQRKVIEEEIKHDFIWLKNSSNSSLRYKILDITGIACYAYTVVMAIPVYNDIICGTNIAYSHLLRNIPNNDANDGLHSDLLSTKIAVFRSRYDNQIFERTSNAPVFDVIIKSERNKNNIIMKDVSQNLWNKITQIIATSKYFYNAVSMLYSDVNVEYSKNGNRSVPLGVEMKHLKMSCNMESITRAISSGVDCLDVFTQLPLEKQIICLREAIMEIGFFHLGHVFDKREKSFVLCCPHLQEHVNIMIHECMLKHDVITRILHDAYFTFIQDFDDFIREDGFVVEILCILSIFRERTGVSSSDLIRKERQIYFDLLEKYFMAKIEFGEWNLSLEYCWQHIRDKMTQVSNVKMAFEKFWTAQTLSLQQNKQSTVIHDFIYVKRNPMSGLQYRLLDINGIAFVAYSVIIEVKVDPDGLISGTNLSFDEFLTRDKQSGSTIMKNSPSFLVIELPNGHQQFFTKRYTDQSDSYNFDVDVTSTLSSNTITMEGMNCPLWRRLNQVIEASVILRQTMCCSCFSSPRISSSSPQDTLEWRQIEVKLTWETMAKTMSKAFHLFGVLSGLPIEDQTIIHKESLMEVGIIQEVPFYDKSTNHGVLPSLNNHLMVCLRPNMFLKFPEGKKIIDMLQSIFNDWDDYLRKDELVSALLTLLCFFKERSGISSASAILINQERSFYLDLLDKYIISKIESREWIASHDHVWSRIHYKMNQINSIKHHLENVVLSFV